MKKDEESLEVKKLGESWSFLHEMKSWGVHSNFESDKNWVRQIS